MKEKWTKIKGHLDWSVSTLGRIRSDERWIVSKRKHGDVLRHWKARILQPTLGGDGYLCIVLGSKNRRNQWIHRLVAQAFIPNPENKRCVNHRDGNKLNNKVSNLEWATHQENMNHSIKNGLHNGVVGSQNWNAKLTESDVTEILRELQQHTCSFIAKKRRVSPGLISQIKCGEIWKHIPRKGMPA